MNNRTKKILTCVLLVVLVATVIPTMIIAAVTYNQESTDEPNEIVMGEVVNIPARTLTSGGESKEAEVRIIAPDGGAYIGKSFTVTSAGLWTVEYFADFDGKTVIEREVYKCTRRAMDMFSGNEAVSLSSGAYSLDDKIGGVVAKVESGAEMVLTPATDLSTFDKNKVFAEFIVDANEEGVSDFATMTITLTDKYDETNRITIEITDAGPVNCNGLGTFIRAGATGQTMSALVRGEVVTLANNGTSVHHSFRNKAEGENTHRTMKLYWDNEEKALYASSAWDYRDPEKVMIADFDDSKIFPDIQWNGFTTGEVDISVSFSDFTSMNANVVFCSFAGYELTEEKYPDEVGPEIRIDYQGESDVPFAEVGTTYSIFPASAIDAYDGRCHLNIDVFYENSDGVRTNVSVKDEKFLVEYIGEYIIRYSATDRTGNIGTEEIKFSSVSSAEPISFDAPPMSDVEVYGSVKLPALDSIKRSGGFGEIKLTRQVTSPTGKVIEDSDSFIPDELGEWTVSYYAEDYCSNHKSEKHIKFNVTSREKPFFIEEVVFPKALLDGFTYTLPIIPAKETVGGSIKDASVECYANGEKLKDGAFTAGGESVVLKYVINGTSGSYEVSQTIPVINGSSGKDQNKYFYGNYSVVYNINDVALSATGSASAVFANTLNEKQFLLGFKFDDETLLNDTESFAITLTDSKSAGVSITVYIDYSAEGVYFSLDGINKKELKRDSGKYSIAFSGSTMRIKDGSSSGTNNFLVEKDDNGTDFKGFNGPVWMTVSTEDGKGHELHLLSLNNHALGYRRTDFEQRADNIGPEIFYEDTLAVKQTIGTTVTLPAGFAYDVMGQVTSFTFSVIAPDGTRPFDNVPAGEEHKIELTQYGIYKVTYTAIDSNGNKQDRTKLFRVNETEAPSLTADKGAIKDKYSVGDTVTIPEYSVSDNGGEYKLNVMLIMPDNETRLLLSDNGLDEVVSYLTEESETYPNSFKAGESAFRLEEKGSYTLIFFVYDSYYNTATVRIDFEVK